jgi:PAS domain S-box-containing protein
MPPSPTSTPRLPTPKLLLVDDVPANLVALEAVFAPLGCEMVRASSGEEALRALLRDDFAAILLDVQMPGLDGFQTAALIRHRDRTRHIPIVFLTAVSKEREFVFRGYEHGAVDYLVKPFNPDILRAKISVFVELHQRREQVRVQADELLRHERAALERESAVRYQSLVDSMPQIVWVSRADGGIELVNKVWSAYTGIAPEAARTGAWIDAIHPDDRAASVERWAKAIATGDAFEAEIRLKATDKSDRWFLVRAIPERTTDGSIQQWIGTATDIDDQKRDREALANAVQAKDDFLAAASHELRTPLAAAKAQVQLTIRRAQPDADPTLLRSLQIVGTQVDRMTRLVEDLLDVSRIQTGRLSLQLSEYDLCERIRGEVERIQALSPSHEIFAELPERLAILADRDRIDQVIINLLTNAVRYSPGGGAVRVTARACENEAFEVAVADKGIGIPQEKQVAIFERFGRAHGARYGGLGLGLTIAQGIIEQHGGRIWVESTGRAGEGSVFRFTLPVRPEMRPSLV